MEPESSQNQGNLSDFNGHYQRGCGGAVWSGITGPRKSRVRLNDQLIPKPTDINVMEKVITVATPRQHPFASHISHFAMFPSFRSPDDPQTGIRASRRAFPNALVPNSAPDVTLVSKTKGHAQRHEVLQSPAASRRKAAAWCGQRGFSDHPKPVKGESQVFYPAPPKTVLPNPELRDWAFTLPERLSSMLRNLERAHWVTSYQQHFAGSGPANPVKMDDFNGKRSDLPGRTSLCAPLRERSSPAFIPSAPSGGISRGGEGGGGGGGGGRRPGSPGFPLLPRPPLLPAVAGRPQAASALSHLQNSFSKTAARRNFSGSLAYAAVNPNHSVTSGRKHCFFGVNSCSLRG